MVMFCVWVVVSSVRAAAETSTVVACCCSESLTASVYIVPAVTSTCPRCKPGNPTPSLSPYRSRAGCPGKQTLHHSSLPSCDRCPLSFPSLLLVRSELPLPTDPSPFH